MRNSKAIALSALAAALLTGAAHAQTTVTFAGYFGRFQDVYTQTVLEPFMAANPDIVVEYYSPGNSAQILGALRAQKDAPQVDLALMDVTVAKAGTDEGIFETIDETVSPHVADLYPAARVEGVAGVGLTFDNTVIVYDKRVFPEPPTSLRAMWDASVDRKVALHAAPDILGLALTVTLDKMAGGTDPNVNLDKGIAELETLAPHVLTWEPKPDLWGAVMSGQAAIGFGYNARSQVFSQEEGSNLGVSLPEEGLVFQINTINLVKNAPAGEAAIRLLDYMLSPEAQKAFTEAMYYAPTNSKAVISEEALGRTAAGHMDQVIDVNWLELAKIRDQITQDWRRKVIPLSN